MKLLILIILLSFTISAQSQEDCKGTPDTTLIDSLLFNATPDINRSPASLIKDKGQREYQRGCCSWHGGVCGCSYGNIVCCDGQLSPSCGC